MSDSMTDERYEKKEACKGCEFEGDPSDNLPCNVCSYMVSGTGEVKYIPKSSTHTPVSRKEELAIDRALRPVCDKVKHPAHYMVCDMEAIDIIKNLLSPEEYKGFLLGNVLKYRMRAGKKDDTQQDIRKALTYEELWEVHFG